MRVLRNSRKDLHVRICFIHKFFTNQSYFYSLRYVADNDPSYNSSHLMKYLVCQNLFFLNLLFRLIIGHKFNNLISSKFLIRY